MSHSNSKYQFDDNSLEQGTIRKPGVDRKVSSGSSRRSKRMRHSSHNHSPMGRHKKHREKNRSASREIKRSRGSSFTKLVDRQLSEYGNVQSLSKEINKEIIKEEEDQTSQGTHSTDEGRMSTKGIKQSHHQQHAHGRSKSTGETELRRLQIQYEILLNDYKDVKKNNIELEHRIRQFEMGMLTNNQEQLEDSVSRQKEIALLENLKKEVKILTEQILVSDLDGEILTEQIQKFMTSINERNEFLEDRINHLTSENLKIKEETNKNDSEMGQLSIQLMKLTKDKKSAEKNNKQLMQENKELKETINQILQKMNESNINTGGGILNGTSSGQFDDIDMMHRQSLTESQIKEIEESRARNEREQYLQQLQEYQNYMNSTTPKSHRTTSLDISQKESQLTISKLESLNKSRENHYRNRSTEVRRNKRGGDDVDSPSASMPTTMMKRSRTMPSENDDDFGSVQDFLINDAEYAEGALWGVKLENQINNRGDRRVIKTWKFTTSDGSAHTVQLTHHQDRERPDSIREIVIDNLPQYRKRSNAGNFHFKINNDDVVLTIQTQQNGWTYELIINGNLWRTARDMSEAIE